MNGTTQAILFVSGVAVLGYGLFELAMVIAGALTGLIFPLIIGGALLVPAVKGRKERKRLKNTAKGLLNR